MIYDSISNILFKFVKFLQEDFSNEKLSQRYKLSIRLNLLNWQKFVAEMYDRYDS